MTVLILARERGPQIDRLVKALNERKVPVFRTDLAALPLVESSRLQIAYTRRVEPADLADLAGVEVTAHLFQRFIQPKAFEARVTVVGDRVFAAVIHANSDPRGCGRDLPAASRNIRSRAPGATSSPWARIGLRLWAVEVAMGPGRWPSGGPVMCCLPGQCHGTVRGMV